MNNKCRPVAGLMRTTCYSMFVTHEHNRPIENKPALKASMETYGFMPSSPLQCVRDPSGALKVIRGHHRLFYAKALKLPVYYVVDESNTDLYSLEGDVSQSWRAKDFVFSLAASGNGNYAALEEFCKRHKIQLALAASMLGGQSAGSGNKAKQLKLGTFEVTEDGLNHAENVMAVANAFAECRCDFSRSSAFLSAVSHAIQVPELDYDHLVSAALKHGHLAKKRGTADEYLTEIEAIYNRFRKSPLLAVKVRAKEEAAKRGKRMR